MQYNAYLRTTLSGWEQEDRTHAILVPNEPFVSISVIFLSDDVSQSTTLPSYVVECSTLPSAENARAHASPVISRTRACVPRGQQEIDSSNTVHRTRIVRPLELAEQSWRPYPLTLAVPSPCPHSSPIQSTPVRILSLPLYCLRYRGPQQHGVLPGDVHSQTCVSTDAPSFSCPIL
jgi:hypothetical protein